MKPINIYAIDGAKATTPFVYLHGKLKKKLGTDQCFVSHKPDISGDYEVWVNGTDRAKLFLWNTSTRQIGLVVACDDTEGIREAKELWGSEMI